MMTRHPCLAGTRASTWQSHVALSATWPTRLNRFFIFFLFFNNIFIILKQLKSKINQIKFRKILENS